MTGTRDLLVEIGTEELPPKALKRLSDAFGQGVVAGLDNAGLAHGGARFYATPRRLAVWIQAVAAVQPNKSLERRGPAVQAAFGDDGLPTRAALGFARSCGVEVEALDKLETDKGSWLVFRGEQPGQPSQALIPDIVRHALDQLPVPKRMRWGDFSAEFVRPVHWVVLLFGDEVIEADILGVTAGRETRGHRFHHPHAMYIGEARGYAPLLETGGHVVADFGDRRNAIRAQVEEAAAGLSGRAVIDEALLDEVTAMVEWPLAVVGDFERQFLDVPSEALISTMKGNQKYFHVVDAGGALMPHFITVSNIASRSPQLVRAGNERVVRPRLADAAFFWTQDRKTPLAGRQPALKNVVFQQKLGSLHAKSQRVATVAAAVNRTLGGDVDHARRAAALAKCDLLTEMVGEFPELQGIMGRYYARHDNEPEAVAVALDEQYMPRHAGDDLPQTPTGLALAIADKLDTLVGIFGIGQSPTGEKDPFALRRAALGVLRSIIENRLDTLDLQALLTTAVAAYDRALTEQRVAATVYDFMMDRLRAYYHEAGVTPDVFEAVLNLRPTRPYDFDQRVRAVSAFRALTEAESLAAANKRAHNILKQAQNAGNAIPKTVEPTLLQETAEKALAEQVAAVASRVAPQLAGFDYAAALHTMAGLRDSVDAFFDQVMVMVDDKALRGNRLALLHNLRQLFLQVADVSRLQG